MHQRAHTFFAYQRTRLLAVVLRTPDTQFIPVLIKYLHNIIFLKIAFYIRHPDNKEDAF